MENCGEKTKNIGALSFNRVRFTFKKRLNRNWHLLIVKKSCGGLQTKNSGSWNKFVTCQHFRPFPNTPCDSVRSGNMKRALQKEEKKNIGTCMLYMIYFKPIWTRSFHNYFMFNSTLISFISFGFIASNRIVHHKLPVTPVRHTKS